MSQTIILPPPYSPFGMVPCESQVLHRMVLGVHGQMVDRRGVGQVLRHRPAHQHAVAFQAQVVVQPTGVVLLDDEQVVIARLWRFFWHRLRCFRRVAHAAVLRQPVLVRHLFVQLRQQVAVFFDALQHLVEAQMPQFRIGDLVPGARRGDRRMFAPAKRIRRDGRLRRRCSGSSPGTPCPRARSSSSSTVTSLGIACSSCCATRLANTTAPCELTGSSSGAYRCRPLLPLVSGYVVSPMSSIRSLTACATSHSCFILTPSPGSRSNTSRVAGPGMLVDEPPLRDVHFQRCLLRHPGHPLDGVDDRDTSWCPTCARWCRGPASPAPTRRVASRRTTTRRPRSASVCGSRAGLRCAGSSPRRCRGSSRTPRPWWYPSPGTAPCPGWSASPDRS